DSPLRLYRELCKKMGVPYGMPSGGGGSAPPSIDPKIARHLSSVDFVSKRLAQMSSLLGNQEKQKIDAFVQGISDIEKKLQAALAGTGTTLPVLGACGEPWKPALSQVVVSDGMVANLAKPHGWGDTSEIWDTERSIVCGEPNFYWGSQELTLEVIAKSIQCD